MSRWVQNAQALPEEARRAFARSFDEDVFPCWNPIGHILHEPGDVTAVFAGAKVSP